MTSAPIFVVAIVLVMGVPACTSPVETAEIDLSPSGTTSADEVNDVSGDSSSADQQTAEEERQEIEVELASYDQQQQRIEKLTGKVIVMDIWSTSCIPCMREFPNLVALAKKYPDKVACISLNIDYIGLKKKPPETYLPKVKEFLESQQALIINLASSDSDTKTLEKYEVAAMPAIMIYDATGKLQAKLTDANAGDDGLTYEGDVIPVVEKLLAAK